MLDKFGAIQEIADDANRLAAIAEKQIDALKGQRKRAKGGRVYTKHKCPSRKWESFGRLSSCRMFPNLLVVGQNTSFHCLLYRRDPPSPLHGRPPSHMKFSEMISNQSTTGFFSKMCR